MPHAPAPSPLPPDPPLQIQRPSASSSNPSSSSYPSSHPTTNHPSPSPRRSPTKRQLRLHAGPDSFVAAESRLDGALTLGTGCVIHPKATLIAAPGASLFLGDGVVIEEMAEVIFRGPGRATIGSGTVVMVGAIVDLVADGDSRAVGEWCTFSPRSRCLAVRVGDSCTVGAGTSIGPHHTLVVEKKGLPPRTVVYGSASATRTWDGSGEVQEREVRVNATAFLREILPKFNKAREESPGITQPQR